MKGQSDPHGRNGVIVPTSPDLQSAEEAASPSLEGGFDDLQPAHLAGAVHDTAEWQKTIEHVVRNVVSIHFCQTCSFDTDAAVSSEATGFVVDAEQGYILTNRVCVMRDSESGTVTDNNIARRRSRAIYRILHIR
jgi:S1-C subfamily serine protease